METVEGTRLHYGDFIVIVAYFAFVLFIGLWVCIKIFFFFLKTFYVHRPNIIFASEIIRLALCLSIIKYANDKWG